MELSGDDGAVVRVWTCRLDAAGAPAVRLDGLVTASERERASCLRFPDHRASALAAAAFVRSVVAAEVGVTPLDLAITSVCRRCGHPTHGRPRLASPDPARPVEFSLAHAGGLGLLAVASRPVGVDVEGTDADLDGPLRLALTADERRRVTAVADHAVATLRLWTQKEAYLKGIGTGLVHDPALVTFVPGEDGWATVVDDGKVTRWGVVPLDVGPGAVASLAVDGGPSEVAIRSWVPPGGPVASPARAGSPAAPPPGRRG